MVYHPQLRRPEHLTIFRCYSKGSTFSLVILRPQVLLWSGASTLNYLHSKNTFAMQKEMTQAHPNRLLDNLISLITFPTSRQSESLQNSRTKIYLSDRHFSSSQYQQTLFIQLIYSCFLITIFPPIAKLHFLHLNTHTTHNSFNHCDEGLTLETQLIIQNYIAILSP